MAVSDFNMGAMENKSLNVFNSRLVIASPATSSDLDFARVEGVVAHEYFHKCDPRAAGARAGPSGGRRRGRRSGRAQGCARRGRRSAERMPSRRQRAPALRARDLLVSAWRTLARPKG